jgi:ribosomal protein L21E
MKTARFTALISGLGLVAVILACGGSTSAPPPAPVPPTAPAVRNYQATASVGDFLTITVDSTAHTIAYTNVTNGETGTVSYTIGSDGAYAITTPNGHMLKAYEIPGLALVASMDDTGPSKSTTSLVTAILKAPISLSWLQNKKFNYMQWRTSDGGMEIGSVSIDGTGNVSHQGYWPFGDLTTSWGQTGGTNSNAPFQGGTFDAKLFTADPSGNFLTLDEGGTNGKDTIFATQGGCFVVDMTNGSLIGVPQAASTTFDATFAGSYKALCFNKLDAVAGGSGPELGTGRVDGYSLTLTAGGGLTVVDSSGATVVNTTIQPVATTSYLEGANKLTDPCPGLFTYRVLPSGSNTLQQDVFLTFLSGGAILFCSFSYDTAQTSGVNVQPHYSYFYGVALKQ